MKKLVLLSILTLSMIGTMAQATTKAKASAKRKTVITRLSAKDATEAFGILNQANLLTEFPAAEYAKLTDLSCNMNRVAAGQEKSYDEYMTCSAKNDSDGSAVRLTGDAASSMMAILETVVKMEEYPGAEYIAVKSLMCNYDRIVQSAGEEGLSCEVEK